MGTQQQHNALSHFVLIDSSIAIRFTFIEARGAQFRQLCDQVLTL